MGDREVPFEKDAKCDGCGTTGAYDFMGDYLCSACFRKGQEDAQPIKVVVHGQPGGAWFEVLLKAHDGEPNDVVGDGATLAEAFAVLARCIRDEATLRAHVRTKPT